MSTIQLEVEERAVIGKKVKSLYKEGKVAGVLYGKDFPSTPIILDSKAVLKAIDLGGATSIVDVTIVSAGKSKKEIALVWSVKRDPVKNTLEHVDLYKVNKDEKVKVRIPLVLSGTSKGVKLGGKLEVYREYMDILAYPQDLISEIVVDITDVGANETVHMEDIVVPSTITKIYNSNIAIFSVKLNTASEDTQK